jgi:hypothetical protein
LSEPSDTARYFRKLWPERGGYPRGAQTEPERPLQMEVAERVRRSLCVVSGFTFIPNFLESGRKCGQFFVREFLDGNHFVACAMQRPDELVELEVHGSSIAVLGVLDQQYQRERHNRSGRVDLWTTRC